MMAVAPVLLCVGIALFHTAAHASRPSANLTLGVGAGVCLFLACLALVEAAS